MRAAYACQVPQKARAIQRGLLLNPVMTAVRGPKGLGGSGADKSFLMCSYRQMGGKV